VLGFGGRVFRQPRLAQAVDKGVRCVPFDQPLDRAAPAFLAKPQDGLRTPKADPPATLMARKRERSSGGCVDPNCAVADARIVRLKRG
jgi:hypothetical protein